jgi:hypothetical protein
MFVCCGAAWKCRRRAAGITVAFNSGFAKLAERHAAVVLVPFLLAGRVQSRDEWP